MAVFITGNHLTMGADMRRRSVVVDFFMSQARAETREIRAPMDFQRIYQSRPQILGALYAFVRSWVEAGKPAPSRTHPSFIEWSNTVAGIVEHAGFASPIPCLDMAPDIDPELVDMEELVRQIYAVNHVGGLTSRGVADLCIQHGLHEERVPMTSKDRRNNTEFGRMLRRYKDQQFANGMIFRIRGAGHRRRYCVELANQQHAHPAGPQAETAGNHANCADDTAQAA